MQYQEENADLLLLNPNRLAFIYFSFQARIIFIFTKDVDHFGLKKLCSVNKWFR